MGREPTRTQLRPEEIRAFTKGLLTDLQALESMLLRDLFETGIRRIGAEQELFLIDLGGRPAPVCTELLEDLEGEEFHHRAGPLQSRDQPAANRVQDRLFHRA